MRLSQLGGKQDADAPPPARVGETIAVAGHVSITMTAVSGIGTRNAAINARMTERDAVTACHGYVGEPVPTRKCIVDWMKEGGGTSNVGYRADCVTGLFSVGGSRAVFLGRNAAASGGDVDEPDYLVRLSDTGEFLQGWGVRLSRPPVRLPKPVPRCRGARAARPAVNGGRLRPARRLAERPVRRH